MKTLQLIACALLLAFILPKCASGQEDQTGKTGEKTYYYGVEINDVLCGYVRFSSVEEEQEGKTIEKTEFEVVIKLSVLGGGVDMLIHQFYLSDPATEQFFFNTTSIEQGDVKMDFSSVVTGDTLFFESVSGEDKKTIPLTPDLILEGPLTTTHIVKDFIHGDINEKTYSIYDPARGQIFEKTYKRLNEEELILAGNAYTCLVLSESNPGLGFTAKQWFDIESGLNVQTHIANRKIYLADPSVVKNITTANLDDVLFAKVGTKISNVHGIEYMKVRAKINSAGEQITPESLNHVRQSFSGSVTDNFIDGIFEIKAEKYDGINAPPFPPDFSGEAGLADYLKHENLIEANEPVLIAKAQEITTGAKDSWEAAVRLSKWVAEEIEGTVPGGTSAINTYKIRQGECGSHSRLLAAFCRAVGIPARLAAGCMYSSLYGGSFGQHAWTEVYMGEAGWIPVDATAFEIDFIDAGHIRLGTGTSFNPEEMEILEYRMTGGNTDSTANAIPAGYQPYLGKYTDLTRNRVFTVVFEHDGIGVDIPGQMVLALNEPDEEGLWYPKLTRQLYFQFPKNTVGHVEKLLVTQLVPIPRKSSLDSLSSDIPEELLPYIGVYDLAQAKLSLDVTYEDGGLAIPDLVGRTKNRILLKQEGDSWKSTDAKYTIRFETNDEGNVTQMVIAIMFEFHRGEPAAFIIEKIIEKEGIEAGITRYAELKAENRGEYIFKEGLLNALGYKLLNQEKVTEAIEIFKLNAEEHPGSFNVYDSLGEAYMKNGQKELATENYQKSIGINPDNETGKKMLEQIESVE